MPEREERNILIIHVTHRIKFILTLHVGFYEQNIVDCFFYHKRQLPLLSRLFRARYQLLEAVKDGVKVHF